jgi:hypothetical protein
MLAMLNNSGKGIEPSNKTKTIGFCTFNEFFFSVTYSGLPSQKQNWKSEKVTTSGGSRR